MGKRVLALVFVLALLTGTFSSALAAETEIDYNISREVRVLGHLADDARREIFANVAAKLKEKWPNIELVDDSANDHGIKLRLELSSGSGPEIFSVDDLLQQELLPYISEISDIVEERNFVERSLEGALSFNNQRTPGQYYSVPFTMSPCAFFYNKAIFEELELSIPTTFEELEAVMAMIKAESDYLPLANAGLSNRQILWLLYCYVMNTAGIEDVRAWYFQQSTPETVKNAWIEAFALLKRWCDAGYLGDVETVLGIDHLVYIANVYGKGNVAMTYDGDWRIADFEATGIETGVFPYPGEYGTNAVDFSWALNKDFDNDPTMRAFFADFVDAFFDPEIVAQFYEAGYTPSVKFDSEGLTVSPLREEFMANTADQKVGYFLDNAAPGMFDVLTKTSQQVMLGELTPEQAWEQMNDRYEQAVSEAQ